MRTIMLAVAIGFVVLTGKAECADDAAKRLPKDGSWVKYHWILTRDDSPRELTGSLTFKIVGTELIDQKKCRWIEGTFIYKEDGTRRRPVIIKMLVNEKVVTAVFGGNTGELAPQDRLPIKAWIKVEDNLPKRMKDTRGPNDFPFLARMMHDVCVDLPIAPFRGEITDSRKEIEAKTVDFQKGKIDCKGYSTRSIRKLDGGKHQTHTTRSVWVTNLAPIGFAECQISRRRLVDDKIDGTVKVNVSLADFGEDAKSALQDHD